MKSLASIFLIFVICIVVAGTNALIDRAQVTIAASANQMQAGTNLSDGHNAATLAEFASITQEKLRLAQPADPVTFDDVRPGDPEYAAAQAVYPYLHAQLLCPECALDARFSSKKILTRAQAAVVLVSILTEQERTSLLTAEQTEDALAGVPDAAAVALFARPYIATALAAGILQLDAAHMVRPSQPYSRVEMMTAFATIERRFPPSAATASLRLANGPG